MYPSQYPNYINMQYQQPQISQPQYYPYNPNPDQSKSTNSDLKNRFNNPFSVYVGDIPKEVGYLELTGHFSKFVIKDAYYKQKKDERWYAYLKFESVDQGS